AVFLVGVSEGLLPISLAETDEAIAEERRLLYVGITRAREHLMLSYARARTVGGRASRKPSRFLDGLWPEDGDARRRPAPRRERRDRVAELAASDPEAAELFERLRTWRGQVATATGKPPYTVL